MPVLTWLTREHDLKLAQNAPCRLLEEAPELSYYAPSPQPSPTEGGGSNNVPPPLMGGGKGHYYPVIGELKNQGEEFECACAIAALKEVKQWVRNLAIQPRASFWLPTASDRFYPDFVVELHDGRILVVEYKGDAYKTNDDSKEKKQVGQLWEEKSGGRGLFLMAEKRDGQGRDVHRQLAEKVQENSNE